MAGVKVSKKRNINVEVKRGVIDRYGEIVEEIKRLEDEKQKLREHIINVYGEGEHIGNEYVISVSKRKSPIVNIVKVYKKLGIKKFLKVISVNLTSLKKYLTQSEIEELAEDYKESYIVSAKKRG